MAHCSRAGRAGLATIVAGIGVSVAVSPAASQSFLDGRSKGMKLCVGAILGGVERKHVKVHGHHFHCRPLRRIGSRGRREVRLAHDVFGKDDKLTYRFRVDSRQRYIAGSMKGTVSRGLSIRSFFLPIFEGGSVPGRPQGYDDIARAVRKMRPRNVKNWRTAAEQITSVVIAQLGWLGQRKRLRDRRHRRSKRRRDHRD